VGAWSVCPTPGCPTLVATAGRCPECKAAASARRSPSKNRGRDSRWQRTSKAYLQANPLCECPECEALPMPLRPAASEVDHIDGLGPLGPRGYDWTNLRSMTKACHSRATARNQPGGWNDRG
jgi:5-methylcytosine-specific restriction protein A